MRPSHRPKVIATPNQMALFSLAGMTSMILGLVGIWVEQGWLVALLTFVILDYFRWSLRKRYIEVATLKLTEELVTYHNQDIEVHGLLATGQLDPDEYAESAGHIAYETVIGWSLGKR